MPDLTLFAASGISYRNVSLQTGRVPGRDLIVAQPSGDMPPTRLSGGEQFGELWMYPASYDNMLVWERDLAPRPRLTALNRKGCCRGFGAGNRIVLSWRDLNDLRDSTTLGGWDGIYRAMLRSNVPFWFVQQSIVRELIPEGVDPADYPGIGHTGGYGPRELLRAGLFAFASLGGYTSCELPIGADADHAIVVGHDEPSLQASLELNKLAISESKEYTKYTVDTSHLFGFPVTLTAADERRLRDVFAGRRFVVNNLISGQPGSVFQYDQEETVRLATKYWRACQIHREIYDHCAAMRSGQQYDYELSLDETPTPTPPRELLYYLVLLEEVMGLPRGGVASAGPNIGFTKRHDYEGTLDDLRRQVNACASVLESRGAMLSVHSADGVRAATGKGPGVDTVLLEATNGRIELKVADVYQEVLWQVLARSEDAAERELFTESWRRTFEAARLLGELYTDLFASMSHDDAQRYLASAQGQSEIVRGHGEAALRQAQGAIGYGLPVFRLAADLARTTDPALPDAEAELFRRFMFLTFLGMRPAIFRTLSHSGWERLALAVENATCVRLRGMLWEK